MMLGRDITLPPQVLAVAPTDCSMIIRFCRDTPPESPWDEPLCTEVEENNALMEQGRFEALRLDPGAHPPRRCALERWPDRRMFRPGTVNAQR